MTSTWKSASNAGGGTVSGLAVTPMPDGTVRIWAGTAVGLFRSDDGGKTWTPTSSVSRPPFIETFAVSPAFERDQTILIGTPLGLFQSVDAGEQWQQVLSGGLVRSIALSPAFAEDRVILVGTDADGVLRSDDGGLAWDDASAGLLDQSVFALAISPDFAVDQTCFVATGSGIYRSRNGGKSWRAADDIPSDVVVQCLAVSPHFATSRLVLAGTEESGLWRTEDGGRTWDDVPDFEGHGILSIAFADGYAGSRTVAIGTDQGIAVSDDNGQTWCLTNSDLAPAMSLAFARTGEENKLIAGLAGEGVAYSVDVGTTWEAASEGLHAALLVEVVPSPSFAQDDTIFAADLQRGVLASSDRGRTWDVRTDGLGSMSVARIVPFVEADGAFSLYAVTEASISRSQDGAETWHLIYGGADDPWPTGAVALAPPGDGEEPTIFAAVGLGELIVINGPETWRSLGRPFGPNQISALTVSPSFGQDHTIWAVTNTLLSADGSEDTILWGSSDGGATWHQLLGEPVHTVLPIAIASDGTEAGIIYVGHGNRVSKAVPGSLFGSNVDSSELWQSVELGAEVTSVTSLVLSPHFASDRTLIVGTDVGVFISRDAGESFTPWSADAAPRSVVHVSVASTSAEEWTVFAVELGGRIWQRAVQ